MSGPLISVVNLTSDIPVSEEYHFRRKTDGTLELGPGMGEGDMMNTSQQSILGVPDDGGGGGGGGDADGDACESNKWRKNKIRQHVRLTNNVDTSKPHTEDQKADVDKLSKPRKRHDCTFPGCQFTTFYAKDLIRHTRKHTGN